MQLNSRKAHLPSDGGDLLLGLVLQHLGQMREWLMPVGDAVHYAVKRRLNPSSVLRRSRVNVPLIFQMAYTTCFAAHWEVTLCEWRKFDLLACCLQPGALSGDSFCSTLGSRAESNKSLSGRMSFCAEQSNSGWITLHSRIALPLADEMFGPRLLGLSDKQLSRLFYGNFIGFLPLSIWGAAWAFGVAWAKWQVSQ